MFLHLNAAYVQKCRPCAYIKRVCPYVAYWYICKKITSMHALCRAQDRGVDVSFPACNKLAVLSVRSILNLFQIQLPLKYWWYAVPCWWYQLPVAQVNACHAIISDNASRSLIHARSLAAWLYGRFVAVISNNGLSKSII